MYVKSKVVKTSILKDINEAQLWAIKKNYGLTETELRFLVAFQSKGGEDDNLLLAKLDC